MEQTARRYPRTGATPDDTDTSVTDQGADGARSDRRRHLAIVDSASAAYRAAQRDASELDARRSAQRLLMAVGTAMHLFAESLSTFAAVDRVDLLRAMAVLTKQVDAIIDADDPLEDLADIVTDDDRVALPDGTTAAVFCRTSWPIVKAIAADRVQASIDGASVFGPEAVFHLAATRAAGTRHPWWGTRRWIELVEGAGLDDLMTGLLLTSPESLPVGLLCDVIGGSWEAPAQDAELP